MPCETDLRFPIGDFRYESQIIPAVTLTPIPSIWGHLAGSGGNPADAAFINGEIQRSSEVREKDELWRHGVCTNSHGFGR